MQFRGAIPSVSSKRIYFTLLVQQNGCLVPGNFIDIVDGFILVIQQFTLGDSALDERAEVDSKCGDLFRVLPALFVKLVLALFYLAFQLIL